jgi:hypothetical protein
MYEQPMAFMVGLVGCKPTVQKVQHFANADQRGLLETEVMGLIV